MRYPAPESESPHTDQQSPGTRIRSPFRRAKVTLALAAVLGLLLTPLGLDSAAAAPHDRLSLSAASALSPAPTPTPTLSPTPTETARTPHEQQNGEQKSERTDLPFMGIIFAGGIGFILAAGAVGVLVAGRQRHRRDRAISATPAAEAQAAEAHTRQPADE